MKDNSGRAARIIKVPLRIFVLLVIMVCCMFLAELILRLFDVNPYLRQEWMITGIPLGWRKLDEDSILVSPEFLDPQYYHIAGDKLSVVTLGDSFTQGYPVDNAFNYPTQLEYFLKEQGVESQVVNLGMGPSGTDQQLAIFEKKCLGHLVPDIVVWQYCYNDFWDNITWSVCRINPDNKLEPHGVHGNWVYFRQKFLNKIPGDMNWKLKSRLVRLILKSIERLETRYVPFEYMKKPSLYGLDKSKLALKRMMELSKEYGFKLYFLLVDLQANHLLMEQVDVPFSNRWSIPEYDAQREFLAGLPGFIETAFDAEALKKAQEHFPELAGEKSIGISLFADETADTACAFGNRHYNEAGYWLLAQTVGEYLLKEFIPLRENTGK